MKIKKKSKKNIINILLILVFIAVCFFCFFEDKKNNVTNEQQSIISILFQAQIAISSLTITTISITTSFADKEIYGVKLKLVLKLRRGFVISFLQLVIILLLFILISYVAVIFNLYYMSIVIVLLTIGFSLWISYQDLPLCFISDKAIIHLLKKNKINIDEIDLDNQETYNTLIVNIIASKKINYVYELLKNKKQRNNGFIDYLFDQIINKLNQFRDFEDFQNKIDFDKYASSILDNILLLMNEDNSLFEEYGDANQSAIYISKIFYYIKHNEKLISEMTTYKFEQIFESLFYLLMMNKKDLKKEIAFKTYQNLIRYSLNDNGLWVVKLLKKSYSKWYFIFDNNDLLNILFSEVSLILFYYCEYEATIKEEFKNEIKEFINNEEEYSPIEKSFSWKSLFEMHLENYSLKVSDMFEYFDLNKFEFMILNRTKTYIFSDYSIADWWIKCLLFSDNFYCYNFDFLNTNFRGEEFLSEQLDRMFEIKSKTLKQDNSFKEFANFFGLEYMKLNNSALFQRQINKLYDFKNNYMKKREEINVSNANIDENLEKFAILFKKGLIDYFNSLGKLDKRLKLKNIDARGFYFIAEMFDIEEMKSLYLNGITQSYEKDFARIFEESFSKKVISLRGDISEAELQKLLQVNPNISTGKIMFLIKSNQNINSELKRKLIDLDKKISEELIHPFVGRYCYYKDGAVKYNYKIEKFEIKKLTEEVISRELDKYKTESGTYFYNGVQYTYKELFDLLNRKLFTIKIYIKYKIRYDMNKIFIFDPLGKEKR